MLDEGWLYTTGASDGQSGVDKARTNLPALILLDMMLPGLDGTSVLKALKLEASTANIPVIVLTGLSQGNEIKLKKAGAAAYIEKSQLHLETGAEALIEAVKRALATCQAAPGSAGSEIAPRASEQQTARLDHIKETIR